MKKGAAYARYSTDRQTENSIAYQLTNIQKYCAEHDILIVATFTDEKRSGTNTDREGFQQLVAAAKRHDFETVVIYDISRGSRDVSDWFSFRKQMTLLGIEVISATGQKLGDLTNSQDFLMELLTVGMGQVEVLNTRQKSIDGVAVKAKEGVFLGGTPPLGYDITNGQYIINPEEAKAVEIIFDMYADGYSYKDILNAVKGVTGKRGRPIGSNSLHSILTNERYIGVYTWNKRRMKILRKWAGGKPNPNCVRIEGAIPPIIDNATWERVQERMKNNKRNASNKATRRTYLLSGLIECECCGASYVGHTSTNTKGIQTAYYCCGNKYRTHTCKAKNVNALELETFVVQQVKAFLRNQDYSQAARELADMVNSASADLAAERHELASIEGKITNGVKAVLSGMDLPELQNELDRLRVRKSELEDILAKAASEHPTVDPAAVEAMLREDAGHIEENLTQQELAALLRQYITKIYAHADGSCTVNIGVHIVGCGGRI